MSDLQGQAFDDADLASIVGDAHVVALGENNHYIAEFGALRARVVRFLVHELGFQVVAMESGFSEGHVVDAWLSRKQEEPNRAGQLQLGDIADVGFTFRFGDPAETQAMLRWIREYNEQGGSLHFAGLDIPGSGGSPASALHRVGRYLATHHLEQTGLVDAAIEATRPYSALNNGISPGLYAELDTATRDAATASLARLVLRLDAVGGRPTSDEHRIARHDALGALRLDEHLREFDILRRPDPPAQTVSSRDVYQAETVRLLREQHGPDARIVLLQHNAHLQRRPMTLRRMVTAPSAGTYLTDMLGDDYLAVGVTAVTGVTAESDLDPASRHGISITSRPLDEPVPDSLELSLTDLTRTELVDLRPARSVGTHAPSTIRHVTSYTAIDLTAAFDVIICCPTMSPDRLAV